MTSTTVLPSPAPPQLTYLLQKVGQEEIEDSGNESFCVSSYFDEDEDIDDELHSGLPQNVYAKWRKAALVVCMMSIGFEFVLGFASLVLSIIYTSPGTFGLAIDSVVDIATTMVVIWRFCGPAGDHYTYDRERRAVFGISVLFIVSSFAVFAKAIFDLLRENRPYQPYILCGLAIISMFIYSALGWAKYSISTKLRSKVLFADAINTLCVDLMAVMLLISLLVYKYTSTWFIGSVFALIIAAFLLLYGTRNAVKYCGTRKTKQLLAKHNE